MIKLYDIKKLGYDFMGYTFRNINELSFHHLIVPHRECERKGLGDGDPRAAADENQTE